MVFGETAVDRFLRNNGLLAMIRAHECQEAGLAQDFDDTVMPFESLGEHEILDGDDRVRKKLRARDDGLQRGGLLWAPRRDTSTLLRHPPLVDLFNNLGAVLLVAWDKACAVAYAARSDPKDFVAAAAGRRRRAHGGGGARRAGRGPVDADDDRGPPRRGAGPAGAARRDAAEAAPALVDGRAAPILRGAVARGEICLEAL